MSTALIQLKEHVTAVLPLLDLNLHAAYSEWMAGDIARGAFEYCRGRHLLALDIISMDVDKVDEDVAFRAGASLFIDLRSAIKDVPVDTMASEQAKIDSMLAFYIDNGYTSTNSFLDIPTKPELVDACVQTEEPSNV